MADVRSDIKAVARRLERSVAEPADCPIRDVLDRIGGKWTLLLLVRLALRPHRFAELRHAVPDISQRMITQSLRELQEDGLVTRHVLPSTPPGVEYRLTPLGTSLMPALAGLISWAEDNKQAVRSSRAVAGTEPAR